jgi:hypothetical protein
MRHSNFQTAGIPSPETMMRRPPTGSATSKGCQIVPGDGQTLRSPREYSHASALPT